ncbi:hypothetical protein EDB83DRAFT_2225763 [Lactarius deliciosus]|nr:hypothetical protein EDB83DRAFT_2225763 [Lactarius deliciosus]
MLLHENTECFDKDENGIHSAKVCSNCASHIHRKKTPPLSLANGMWVGTVPGELSILTLPERILIGRHFPAAYIIKLYPKKQGASSWCPKNLQSGLRGNISTYRLNTNDIASMTDAQLMPPTSSILAATIGVTFVGPKNLPEKTMPGFLRVNRARVHTALVWLKANNPLYRDIVICLDRLECLPANGIPLEISSLVKFLPDEEALAHENDGYVPEEDLEDGGECLFVEI